jgi:hypothetical protein
VACEGLWRFGVELGSSYGEAAAELERALGEEDKDMQGRAVLGAALRLSNTKELESPTMTIFPHHLE